MGLKIEIGRTDGRVAVAVAAAAVVVVAARGERRSDGCWAAARETSRAL